MIYLNEHIEFPDPSYATEDGLLAIGGDLKVERLIEAYKRGIFPWFDKDQPILWWSPDPRFVLFPEKLIVSKSMKQFIRNADLRITFNTNFRDVISECAKIDRHGQDSSWITASMIDAYCQLHELGYAKSVEVWQDDQLVAGLYGVDLGNSVFCGESMFTKLSNASKAGFINFVQSTSYKLIDCQVYTSHLESLGAEYISRSEFISFLN
ncbi:MAG: leucyl/phenylalanyl-tRNA--protein transferase [Flavobacteriaceae bacterium]|nr:leucyl/phenylalanyl-tRNA--protein transferase [Flavobacteriaceae bacterium]